ncbi:bacteriophage protein [Shigella sonnei]|nr:bacteriophage protein [Shigella sonnei]SJI81733.1 bacteriophage protein [Shigella sonnei]SJJ81331.1 bacteriophage protein [Shigella sonnei]
MKFSKFSELVNRILSNKHSQRCDMNVTIVVHSPGSIGSTPSVDVQSIQAGFDWDSGQVMIFPAQQLTTLTPEQVADITESVRKGQSWHAYQEYKKHKEQLEKLSIELEAARKRIVEQGNKVTPVSAELPPANESVLLFDANGEGWLIGWRSLWYTWGQKETGEWQWTFQVGDLENVNITHWAVMPKAPEAGA